MEELLNQRSAELSRNDHDPIWISVIDLEYAYGQMRLAPETSKHCIFAVTSENVNGYYRFLKGFYGPADIPTIFQEKMYRTLGHKTLVWLDDIIIVNRETKEDYTRKVFSVLSKLENEQYRARKKIKILPNRNNMARTHNITRRHQTQTQSTNWNPPSNTKTLTSILGAIQYFAKFIHKISE